MKAKNDLHQWMLCWAVECRKVETGNGWPKQQPFYVPPRTGNLYSDVSRETITEYDWEMGRKIHGIYGSLRLKYPEEAQCVRAFYGAYPNYSPDPKKRIDQCAKELEITSRKVYDLKDRGVQFIDGALSILV